MEPTQHELLAELQSLREELYNLKQRLPSDRQRIEMMLRRRGLRDIKYTAVPHRVLTPEGNPVQEHAFYRLMKRYSFRIFLRDLITYIQTPQPHLLTRYCSERVAHRYLEALLKHHLIHQRTPSEYAFPEGISPRFGDTLEWFVARVLRTEFASPAAWGIRIGNGVAGGDYDVIASVEGHLVYIEVKSSPPKHIEPPEITGFLDRIQNLRPDVAIFLEDTQLRMKDKVVVMFEEELQQRYGTAAQRDYPVQRLHREMFFISPQIFIINTKPRLTSNLGFCLRQFLTNRFVSFNPQLDQEL